MPVPTVATSVEACGISIILRLWNRDVRNSRRNGDSVSWPTTGGVPTRRCWPTMTRKRKAMKEKMVKEVKMEKAMAMLSRPMPKHKKVRRMLMALLPRLMSRNFQRRRWRKRKSRRNTPMTHIVRNTI